MGLYSVVGQVVQETLDACLLLVIRHPGDVSEQLQLITETHLKM